MPSAYTHNIIAEEALPDIGGVSDSERAMYLFGAQGGDPMFFFRFVKYRSVAPGKLLHRMNIYGGLCAMCAYVRSHPEAMAYASGYISHYAADTVFHPFVYCLADRAGGTRMDRNMTHTRAERELDAYFVRKKRGVYMHSYALPYAEEDIGEGIVAGVLGAALGTIGISADVGYVKKAISGYFRFLRGTFDAHGLRRRVSEAIGRAGIKPFGLLGALFSREDYSEETVNESRREWYNVMDGSVRRDSASDLLSRAVRRTAELIGIFRMCCEKDMPLPVELFSDNLLTGLPELYGDIDKVYGDETDWHERVREFIAQGSGKADIKKKGK